MRQIEDRLIEKEREIRGLGTSPTAPVSAARKRSPSQCTPPHRSSGTVCLPCTRGTHIKDKTMFDYESNMEKANVTADQDRTVVSIEEIKKIYTNKNNKNISIRKIQLVETLI